MAQCRFFFASVASAVFLPPLHLETVGLPVECSDRPTSAVQSAAICLSVVSLCNGNVTSSKAVFELSLSLLHNRILHCSRSFSDAAALFDSDY